MDVYEIVTEQVIAALEAGTVPWHQPWNAIGGEPKSLSSRKSYRGVNTFLLSTSAMTAGYDSPWWVTYKQASERGGQVRKGEKSTLVVFWKMFKGEDKVTGKDKQIPMLRYFRVFNACQCDDLKVPAEPERREHLPIESCETIANGYLTSDNAPSIQFGGDRACFSPSLDQVRMPIPEAFKTAEGYYSTLFHELTHSTGSAKRLARKDLLEMHYFGDENYSREELVAEMGAAMLSGVAGIDQLTVPKSAAYIESWLRGLKGDKKLVVAAAGQAQRAADLIRGIQFDKEVAA